MSEVFSSLEPKIKRLLSTLAPCSTSHMLVIFSSASSDAREDG